MKRIAVALVAAGVVVAAVLVLTAGAGAGPFGDWQSDGGYNGVGILLSRGQVGATTLSFPRTLSAPVVLLGVRPLHPQEARGVTLRYAATTGPFLGRAYGWKPRAWKLHPLAGFVVPPHVGGGVTIGASSRQAGVHYIRGFVIDYRVGVTDYSAPQQYEIELCVAVRRCPSGD